MWSCDSSHSSLEGRMPLGQLLKHEDDIRPTSTFPPLGARMRKGFDSPALLHFLISSIPFLHLLLHNQQSLFLLLTFSHSFCHHLSFLPFILHGQSLSLSSSLISFSHLLLLISLTYLSPPLPPPPSPLPVSDR